MRNLLLFIKFKGTNYKGYQVQNKFPSIMETVQNAIFDVTKMKSDIIGCSRTDAGVHANMYCLNFKTNTIIPNEKIAYTINNKLPNDVVCYKCIEVHHNFHARYYAKGKEYIYKIKTDKFANPLIYDLVYYFPYNLDVDKMKKGAKYFVGTHDFKAFSNCDEKKIGTTIKTIRKCTVSKNNDEIEIKVVGDNFLTHMVRIIVGTLLEIGSGKINANDIVEIMNTRDRKNAGSTAPAHGLYLNKVFYNEEYTL